MTDATDNSTPITDCPVCGSGEARPYVSKNGYNFLKCGCGYVFCYPRPTQEQLGKEYSMGDSGRGISASSYPKVSSRRRRGFFNGLKLMRYFFARRALDVGCGGGFVVGAMKLLGARESHGIDINPNAIDYARAHYPGSVFHIGSFHELAGKISGFDFVYSSEVIEHVEDVNEYVRFIKGALNPGGTVFLTTPDIGSPKVPTDVTRWDVFEPPVHIQFFNRQTLDMLMAKHGFSPVRRAYDRGGAGLKMIYRLDD